MAYKPFHELHEDLRDRDQEPAFYDTDGSPVYQDPYGHLIGEIVALNDVAALRLYHSNPKMNVWYEHYEAYHWHPAFVAANSGSMDALRLMLEIYVTDPRYVEPLEEYMKRIEFSPINEACAAADRELVLWLLHHDPPLATLHDCDTLGETPLFRAAEGLGARRINLRYIESGIAKLNKHEDLIFFLLDQGCSVPDSNVYSIPPVEKEDDTHQDRKLLKTVLGAAMPNASYKLVSRLLKAADIHVQQGWRDYHDVCGDRISAHTTALHIAARYWNTEGIRALLDNCGDVSAAEMVSKTDDCGRIPLHWALAGPTWRFEDSTESTEGEHLNNSLLSQRAESIKLLLDANPDTINMRDTKGATCFNYAMRSTTGLSSMLPIVKMLLDAKPDPSILNARNPVGPTALQDFMIYHGRPGSAIINDRFIELVETLLDNGASTHLCLHQLCHRKWMSSIPLALIDRLLESNDVNETDAAGCTAMHYLVQQLDQVDAFHRLISRGANVNIVDHKGNTPLHHVAQARRIPRPAENGGRNPRPRDTSLKANREWLKNLEKAGGSINQPNASGKTPNQLLDERLEELTLLWARIDRNLAQRGRGRGLGRGRGI